MTLDNDKFLRVGEASDLLGITRRGLVALHRMGGGPQVHRCGRAYMYRVGDLISWALCNDWVLDLAQPAVAREVERLDERREADRWAA